MIKNCILGVNHQFLYPDSITDNKVHYETLKKLASMPGIDALDCWVCRDSGYSDKEIQILRESGKVINYNIGDRFGEAPVIPASADEAERIRAYDTVMREIGFALRVGAKKIVFASGPDIPHDRGGAKERFFEFVNKILGQIPDDVVLALEPTDWDIDKHFLFGPLDETVEFIEKVNARGFTNFGLLIDMCHVPIMHETLESAIEKANETLVHIHLGNCVIKNKNHEFYGDKHVPWDYPGGEYSSNDGVEFLKLLDKKGYFSKSCSSVSFEMRPVSGMSAEESLNKWIDVLNAVV